MPKEAKNRRAANQFMLTTFTSKIILYNTIQCSITVHFTHLKDGVKTTTSHNISVGMQVLCTCNYDTTTHLKVISDEYTVNIHYTDKDKHLILLFTQDIPVYRYQRHDIDISAIKCMLTIKQAHSSTLATLPYLSILQDKLIKADINECQSLFKKAGHILPFSNLTHLFWPTPTAYKEIFLKYGNNSVDNLFWHKKSATLPFITYNKPMRKMTDVEIQSLKHETHRTLNIVDNKAK